MKRSLKVIKVIVDQSYRHRAKSSSYSEYIYSTSSVSPAHSILGSMGLVISAQLHGTEVLECI